MSQAMGVEVREATDSQVVLSLPLAPNINHQESAFGGSIGAAGMLSCWTLLHLRLRRLDNPTRLVIHKSKIVFREPIVSGFEAICRFSNETAWQDFLQMLDEWNQAKLLLKAEIRAQGQRGASFQGSFVALKTALDTYPSTGGE